MHHFHTLRDADTRSAQRRYDIDMLMRAAAILPPDIVIAAISFIYFLEGDHAEFGYLLVCQSADASAATSSRYTEISRLTRKSAAIGDTKRKTRAMTDNGRRISAPARVSTATAAESNANAHQSAAVAADDRARCCWP